MFVRIVKMSFKEDKIDDFINNFNNNKVKIRNTQGCKLFELYRDKTNPTIFFTYSYWDTELDLENYRNSQLFPYDLEERTFQFAKEVRVFIKTLEKTIANNEDAKQVIRSSGSIGSNYIEANESLSKKDFVFRLKISRKEAKESIYWLKLIDETNDLINNQLSKN
jgi:four helix bundle protein